jgi:hypothetical protein
LEAVKHSRVRSVAQVRRAFVGFSALLVLACGDFRFDTEATYRAPIGRFDIFIHAAGVVRAGDDLASASSEDVRITPLDGARGSRIDLRITLPAAADSPNVAGWIRRSGYDATPAELDEVNRVVALALGGSKSTLVQGQTKALQVVNVRFRHP